MIMKLGTGILRDNIIKPKTLGARFLRCSIASTIGNMAEENRLNSIQQKIKNTFELPNCHKQPTLKTSLEVELIDLKF